MADKEHLEILKKGVKVWNEWRFECNEDRNGYDRRYRKKADLSNANLRGTDLKEADLSEANLRGADLSNANLQYTKFIFTDLKKAKLRKANMQMATLSGADLTGADLRLANLNGSDLRGGTNLSNANLRRATLDGADLHGSNLSGANLIKASLNDASLTEVDLRRATLDGADLSGANLLLADLNGASLIRTNLNGTLLMYADLSGANLIDAEIMNANLSDANLSGANLSGAFLEHSIFVRTDLTNTTLEYCNIYGISAWDLKLEGAEQKDLIITPSANLSWITVDNLEVAQFIYLLLYNEKIRHVIDTITTKVVLILGRFTPKRKPVLDAIREELRKRDYIPVMFDFDKPIKKDLIETVKIIANLAKFVIADITSPRIVREELITLVPSLPSIPFQILLQKKGKKPYITFPFIEKYNCVLPVYYYSSIEDLLSNFEEGVIKPAETKVIEIKNIKKY